MNPVGTGTYVGTDSLGILSCLLNVWQVGAVESVTETTLLGQNSEVPVDNQIFSQGR